MQPDPRETAQHPSTEAGVGLHEVVARVAKARPDAVALVSGRQAMTYRELDQAADSAAAALVQAGTGPRDLIPVLLPRSPELVISLLAVLKTGAAYALLDPCWPDRRLREVFEMLDAPLLVAEDAAVDRFGLPVRRPSALPATPAPGFQPVTVDGGHPACVFFTSGTTGRPKCVLSPHRATARLFPPDGFALFTADTVVPLAAPVSWDAFSLELWSVLLNGGTSVILNEPYLSASALRAVIHDHGVNTAWLTASLFNMTVEEDLDAFTGLGQLMIGGERVSPTHVARFLDRHPSVTLLNGYGPVESTVFATTHRITAADCASPDGIPLGRAVPHTRVHVLDGSRRCAPGETGEICIDGEGLALCYLADPALTEEKFAQVEIDEWPQRVFRTGDLGVVGADGLLRFHGRADRQLKIRGHRVEPAEVERQVEQLLPAVGSCRVLARPDASGTALELVAFCRPVAPGDPLPNALAVLRAGLVSYQRPTVVVSVDAFPLTARGKLDDRALLALAPATRTATVVTPVPDNNPAGPGVGEQDPTLRLVTEVFGSVLGTAAVPHDIPFVELGGSSLAAGRVCTRLSTLLNRPVPLSRLYQHSTVAALAAWLRATEEPAVPAAVPAEAIEGVPLAPMQVVYLTRHLSSPADRTAHCLLTWVTEGELDREALQSAIDAVHHAHEPLSAVYLPDPTPAAWPLDIPPPPLEVLPGRPSVEEAVQGLRDELTGPLEPTEGEVWRTALVPVKHGALPTPGSTLSVFGCVVHHIAFDGWSESLLANDLAAAYRQALGREAPAEPAKPSLSALHAARLRRLAHADLQGQFDDLRTELQGVPSLHWPAGPAVRAPAAPRELVVRLPPEVTAVVDAMAAETGVTRFGVLLHHFAACLAEATGQRDFAVGVPVAQRADALLSRAVGCHLTMLCVRMRGAALDAGPTGIRETGALVSRAFAAQDVSFTSVLRLVDPPLGGRPPLFQTLFALQDNAPPRLDLPGVRTTFRRLPYADLPVELHTELWPEEDGGIHLVVSYQPHAVAESTAQKLFEAFTDRLRNVPSGVRP